MIFGIVRVLRATGQRRARRGPRPSLAVQVGRMLVLVPRARARDPGSQAGCALRLPDDRRGLSRPNLPGLTENGPVQRPTGRAQIILSLVKLQRLAAVTPHRNLRSAPGSRPSECRMHNLLKNQPPVNLKF